jgi:IS5 family transposase
MRKRIRHQLPLMQASIGHPHARELETMSELLDEVSGRILARVEREITKGRDAKRGRRGMDAEQVLRAVVVKQMNGFSYEELAFHLADSATYRTFCRIGFGERPPSRSTLQENIKRLSAKTLEQLNRGLVRWAREFGVETGRKVRCDTVSVESDIHDPTDSQLLWDVNRVLIREMKRARRFGYRFVNHERKAKRRTFGIMNAKRIERRVPLYRDLLKVTEVTLREAERIATGLEARTDHPIAAQALAGQLRGYVERGRQVMDQTWRRVMEGESVPAAEKIVSIFETHTDILVKGSRETLYGHKVDVSCGRSGLVLDCQVERGNPADKILAIPMVERLTKLYGEVPRQVAFDGAFASRENLKTLKAMGVEDVAFSKRCGLEITEMVKSTWVYRKLRDFRAGIEGILSFLKRCFGLDRCTWKGFASFTAYVWSSVVSANLLLLARRLSGG